MKVTGVRSAEGGGHFQVTVILAPVLDTGNN
jgi:hypothetical protein